MEVGELVFLGQFGLSPTGTLEGLFRHIQSCPERTCTEPGALEPVSLMTASVSREPSPDFRESP